MMEDSYHINVLDVVDQDDGSAVVSLDMGEDAQHIFIQEGLRVLFEEKDVKILPVEAYKQLAEESNLIKEPVQYELSAQDAQHLLELGFIRAIEEAVQRGDNVEATTTEA